MAMPLAVMKYLHYRIALIAKVIWKKIVHELNTYSFTVRWTLKQLGSISEASDITIDFEKDHFFIFIMLLFFSTQNGILVWYAFYQVKGNLESFDFKAF